MLIIVKLSKLKGIMNENTNENSLDDTWLSMPWTWNSRGGAADSADRAVLYGNLILLCQKLTEAARLVSGNQDVQKAPGFICETKSNDNIYKA
jgi:hypothetical protein